MQMLYIIGVPGSGKTTVVRHLTRKLPTEQHSAPYIVWTRYSSRLIQLGYERKPFGGTDALGMRCQPDMINKIREWKSLNQYPLILAEGDRLANNSFFEAMIGLGVKLTVVHLATPEAVVITRRKERNERIGKAQSDVWLKTRDTKVNSLAAKWVQPRWVLDGSRPVQALSKELAKHPVGREFVRLREKAGKHG